MTLVYKDLRCEEGGTECEKYDFNFNGLKDKKENKSKEKDGLEEISSTEEWQRWFKILFPF